MFKRIKEWWRRQKVEFRDMVAEEAGRRFSNQMFTWIGYDALKEILDDPKVKERGYVDYGYLCDRLAQNCRKDDFPRRS